MNTDTTGADVEAVTMSDILQLNNMTWDRPRSTDELMSFITRRESALSNSDDE